MSSAGVLGSGRPRRRRARRLLIALTVLVLLLAALLAGGGWYYAGQIDAEALAADHRPDPQRYDLQVTAFGDGEVALRRTGSAPEHDLLPTTDVSGLVWPGGSGVLTGAPAEVGGGTVARSLRVTDGAAPAAGTPAALRTDVWADPRQARGRPAASPTPT